MPPAVIAAEWRARRTECTCGFPPGKHPVCVACGAVIGPTHLERFGRMVPVPVFYDAFDDTVGLWEVACHQEPRRMCRNCAVDLDHHRLALPSLRIHSRVRMRLVQVNRWRRAHQLPPADFATPFAAAAGHFEVDR